MEEGLAKRLIQVGIRTINGHQREQAERFGVEIIEMRNWRDDFTLDFDSPVHLFRYGRIRSGFRSRRFSP